MAIGGKLSDWQHGTNGAPTSLTSFTAKTREASINFGIEEVDATVWGDTFREYEQSFTNATISAIYKADATLFTQITDILTGGLAMDWQLGPDGITTGKPKMTGSMIMTGGLNLNLAIGDLQVYQINWRVTGAVTFATFA